MGFIIRLKMSTEKKETGIAFKLVNTNEKPQRTYKKGSKFDSMLDAFIESGQSLVRLETEKSGNYMRTQLVKRVAVRKLDILVSVINDNVYLEKGIPTKRGDKKSRKLKSEKPLT